MALTAVALILPLPLPVPGQYLAWAVFAGAAALVAADIPCLAGLIGEAGLRAVNFRFVGRALFGSAAALRLY